jgi:hypothetical protein
MMDEQRNIMKISLIFPTKAETRGLGEVRSPAVLSIDKTTFDDDGLYSTRIFGAVGSQDRMNLFGFIDLKVKIMHPLVWNDFVSLKSLYHDIASGKKYGTFNEETKDIVVSNIEEGHTGYQWVIEQIPKIEFKDNDSNERRDKITVLKKNMDRMLVQYLYIVPAGLREYQLEDNPSGEEHEINDLYRKILNSKALVDNINFGVVDVSSVDAFRFRIQNAVNDVYNYIIEMNDGKNKFVLSSWTKRSIDFGTRSVISALPLNVTKLEEGADTINQTVAGIYIVLKAISPLVLHQLENLFFSNVINKQSNTARTYIKGTTVAFTAVRGKEIDKWTTLKGIEEILSEMYDDNFKNSEVTLDGKNVIMVHDTGDTIEVVDEFTDLDEKDLRPITYGELFYITILPIIDELYPLVTRYPIDSEGSIYPSKLKVLTTLPPRSTTVKVKVNSLEFEANEYPTLGATWTNIISPNTSRWPGLGSDNDGDKVSFHIPMEEDAKEEIRKKMEDPSFYIKPTGDPYFVLSNTINENVMSYIMTDME